MARDNAADAVSDGKDALDLLFREVEDLRSAYDDKTKELAEMEQLKEEVTMQRDDALQEIERLKAMAFEEIVREVGEARLT